MTQFAIIYLRSLLAALSHVSGMIFFRLKATFSGLGAQSVNVESNTWSAFFAGVACGVAAVIVAQSVAAGTGVAAAGH